MQKWGPLAMAGQPEGAQRGQKLGGSQEFWAGVLDLEPVPSCLWASLFWSVQRAPGVPEGI